MGKRLALRMLPVVGLEELRSECQIRSFPRIICCGVAFPPYQVLQLTPFSKEPMSHDGLDLVFFFSVDHFGWWLVEIDPVLRSFLVHVSNERMERRHGRFRSAEDPTDKRQVILAW